MKNKLYKKIFALTFTLVFTFVLTACQSTPDTQESTNAITSAQGETNKESSPPPVTDKEVANSKNQNSNKTPNTSKDTPSVKPSEGNSQIDRNKALEIALKDAKLQKSQVHDLEIELDKTKNTLHYDVSFEYKNKEYEYEINAKNGKILSTQKPDSASSDVKITKDRAQRIAFNSAGVNDSTIRDYEIELDKENGIWKYEVSFEKDNTEYEIIINATTGKILHSHTKIDK